MNGFKLFFMLLACIITGRSIIGLNNDGNIEKDE